MVDVDRAVIARLKKEGHTFEILVDCDAALEFKQGKSISLGDVVATDDVFKDVKKGEKASNLQETFGTDDVMKIAETIIKEGDIQLTAKHRDVERDKKRKQIIDMIHRNAVDSQTGLPHPPQRIENAMNEASVHIDENKSAEEQIEAVLEKLRPIIPIKFEVLEVEVHIPAQYAGQAFPLLKKYKLIKDQWESDGSLRAVVEIPGGIQDELYASLNKLTQGNAESKVLKKS